MAKGLWKLIALSLAGVLAVMVIVVISAVVFVFASNRGLVEEDTALLAVIGVMAVLMMALALWLGFAWMVRIDEAAREAHKSAWYWGGTAGMAVGGVGVILSGLDQAEALRFVVSGRTDPAAYMAAGAMLMLLLMLAGYTIVWAWWWLARR